ncbi:alpha/beta fold hydrolase [Epilithonimonas xixisoli]|uniref:Prolyl oligopeptidase family protein n=1 Tax=Epilithonimonas xixisoli TaxID=1476462 RepID=A0A4R8I716_9FLAO|nr:alpha/beta fold hydrolase [Epilithonimonas xixisoli]TDX84205.1 prolyl oligopeptidase family protein [Epilithonimonas xixisoli]
MIQKSVKFFSFLILILSIVSCVCHQTKSGTRTEIFDKKDSLKSLARIKEIKNLDYSDFKAGKFDDGKVAVNYRLLKPKNLNQTKKYPLILVFHGSGAIGTNNTSQMGVLSKMWLLPKNREKFQAYVLSPQFPIRSSNYHLDESRNVKVSQSNEYLDLVLKSIDSLITKENIDPSRIYVMGFSMGGATTSNAISKRPDLFAGAINISGISQFDKMDELLKMPIWIVHGSLDTDNFPQSNFKFFEEMKTKGNVFLWEYKDRYHNNILSAELVDEIPKWLFKQTKN